MTAAEIEGVANFRDVGGIAAASGVVRSGQLYRSGQLSGLTAQGTADLGARVRRVIDLRTDAEVASALTPPAVGGVVRMPLYSGSVERFFTEDFTIEDIYCHLLEYSAPRLVSAVRLIADGEPTLVHCAAGKDRTGVTIALALAAVEADREAIVADYALTAALMPAEEHQATAERLRRKYPSSTHAAALATHSPAEVMREMLASIDEAWGSATGYLAAYGFSDDDLRALRTALVDTEPTSQGAVS